MARKSPAPVFSSIQLQQQVDQPLPAHTSMHQIASSGNVVYYQQPMTQGNAYEQQILTQLQTPVSTAILPQQQVDQLHPAQVSMQQILPTGNVVYYEQPGETPVVQTNQPNPRPGSCIICSVIFLFIMHPMSICAFAASVVSVAHAETGDFDGAKEAGSVAKVLHIIGWTLNCIGLITTAILFLA